MIEKTEDWQSVIDSTARHGCVAEFAPTSRSIRLAIPRPSKDKIRAPAPKMPARPSQRSSAVVLFKAALCVDFLCARPERPV